MKTKLAISPAGFWFLKQDAENFEDSEPMLRVYDSLEFAKEHGRHPEPSDDLSDKEAEQWIEDLDLAYLVKESQYEETMKLNKAPAK